MSIHDDGLKSKALRFYKEIGYRGIGSLEFKKDERNGEYRLLELNARPWRQNIQTAYANINFALLQYLDLLEKPVEPIWNYKDGVRWFDSIEDLESHLSYRMESALSFGDWVNSWLGSECHAHFAWDDSKPAVVASEYGLVYAKLLMGLLRSSRKTNA